MASKKDTLSRAADAQKELFEDMIGISKPKAEEPKAEAKPKEKVTPKRTAKKTAAPKKEDLKMFSVRMPSSQVASWQAYCKASDSKSGDLTAAALQEYIENHPLTAEQTKAYKAAFKFYSL